MEKRQVLGDDTLASPDGDGLRVCLSLLCFCSLALCRNCSTHIFPRKILKYKCIEVLSCISSMSFVPPVLFLVWAHICLFVCLFACLIACLCVRLIVC